MKLIEILDEIKNLNINIQRGIQLVQFYDEQASVIPGPMYDVERVDKTRSNKAPFEIWIFKKLDKEREIEQCQEQLKNLKLRVVTALESLTNQNYAMIIMYRHLSFMTYKQIMKKMHLSRSSAYRLYDEAMIAIKDIEA